MHALISIGECTRQAIDNIKFGCALFIDLRKTFDTVNHAISLTKLNHYGIEAMRMNGLSRIYHKESNL